VSFDLVAPHYRWLEAIAFGNALQRARTRWIDTIARPKRTLILGEGDGRFLCELVRAHPKIDVDCIDASAAMLHLARARLSRTHPESVSRVHFICEDILQWSPRKSYDLLVTHFFLDCFPATELQAIVAKLARAAEPDAVWLIADFTIPRKRFARGHARVLAANDVHVLSRGRGNCSKRTCRSGSILGRTRIYPTLGESVASKDAEIRCVCCCNQLPLRRH